MFKKITNLILLGTLFLSAAVFAGTFSPTPTSPGASDYTLSDIYNKISSSTYSYSPHTFAPATTPNSTYLTLTEIWDAIPPFKTLISGDLSSGLLLGGIYDTVTDLATIEPNLIPENIALGTTIFGVEGSYEVSGCDATCQALRNGLIAYYPLDTDTDDYSGSGLNGANNGTTQTTGNVDGAYSLNGSTYINISNDSSFENISQLSISSWVNLYNFEPCCGGNEDGFILAKGDGLWWNPTYALGYYKTGTPNTALFNVKGTPLPGTTELIAGTWYHLVGTYDGSTMKLYVNGVLEGTVGRSGPIIPDGCDLVIGGSNLGGCGFQGMFTVNGKVDEVALYSRALSESEVADLYNDGSGRSLINN